MTRRTRRPRTTRNILNLTSTKKRDNMPPINIGDDPTVTDNPGVPKVLSGNTNYGMLFCPSARNHEWTEGVNEFARAKTVTFCKGYAERITFSTNSPANWLWRRIVFSTKDDFYTSFPDATLELGNQPEGYTRTMWNFLGSHASAEPAREALEEMLFQGTDGTDWNDRFLAKVDTRRVTVHQQFTRRLQSNNSRGVYHHVKTWVPINKNLVYDEDENANSKEQSLWSTSGKPGIGNLFVYDVIACADGADTDQMLFNPQGTYYWHEK